VASVIASPNTASDDVEPGLGIDAEASELEPRAAEARASFLVAPVVELAQQSEFERAAEYARVGLLAPHLRQLVEIDLARLLLLERLAHRLGEAQDLLGLAAGALDQALDRLEIEALRLKLADQLDARDVLLAVVARAAAQLGRLEEPARLVRADVAHGQARPLRELVDRHAGSTLCAIHHQ
jgi:hypothetical protein